MIHRLFKFSAEKNIFLLGPRQTGKSALIKNELKNILHFEINLLKSETYKRYQKNPEFFKQDILYKVKNEKIRIIFVDEIQKLPILLDDIHFLIEEYKIKFILSGSSPRKLKKGQANLLGGRVPIRYLFPFTYLELNESFNLEQALIYGTLPGIYFLLESDKRDSLITYVETYLKEEILAEGIIRNLEPFSRFLDICGIYNSELLNYSNISRESAVALKTVQNYFQILEDTLIAYKLPAWDKSVKKQLALTPKFYFFDNGITSVLNNQLNLSADSNYKGKVFEQYIINELRAIKFYKNSLLKFHFWRTVAGSEVDLLITDNNKILTAIEIKYKTKINSKDFSGLKSFREEQPMVPLYLVYTGEESYEVDGITILHYKTFIKIVAEKII